MKKHASRMTFDLLIQKFLA